MRSNRSLALFNIFALALLLSAVGCKSGTQQTSTQPASNQTAQSGTTSAPGAVASNPGTTTGAAPSPGGTQPASGAAPAPQGPPPPAVVELPVGTELRVRLDEDLGSKISQPGDSFTATIADDVHVNGQVVIAKGARADGTVVDAKPLGKFAGGAVLQVRLDRVHTQWGSYPVSTSSISRAEKGKGKRSTAMIGGGAGFGALIGGLAGGGKGAAIGLLAGGGAGTAGSAFTGNKQIVLPAETLLTFKLEHGVHITEQQ